MSVLSSYLIRTTVVLYTTRVDEKEVRIHKVSWQGSHLGGTSRTKTLWDEGDDPEAKGTQKPEQGG